MFHMYLQIVLQITENVHGIRKEKLRLALSRTVKCGSQRLRFAQYARNEFVCVLLHSGGFIATERAAIRLNRIHFDGWLGARRRDENKDKRWVTKKNQDCKLRIYFSEPF